MQQVMPWSRWQRWQQALRFGLPLALLELCVLISFYMGGNREILGTYSWELQATILSLLLYLVVAALAGYWFCRHGGQRSAWAGLDTGVVGAIIVTIVMIPLFGLMYLRFVDMLRTCQLRACGPNGPADYLSILGSFFLTLALLNGAGILLSALGGWLGGIIANWRAMPREQVGEQQA